MSLPVVMLAALGVEAAVVLGSLGALWGHLRRADREYVAAHRETFVHVP